MPAATVLTLVSALPFKRIVVSLSLIYAATSLAEETKVYTRGAVGSVEVVGGLLEVETRPPNPSTATQLPE